MSSRTIMHILDSTLDSTFGLRPSAFGSTASTICADCNICLSKSYFSGSCAGGFSDSVPSESSGSDIGGVSDDDS